MNYWKIFGLISVVTLMSCRVEKTDQSDVQYASDAYKIQHSLLPTINKLGHVEGCFQAIGGETSERQQAYQDVNEALSTAVEEWNNLLVGQPGWKHAKVSVKLTARNTCTPTAGVLTIRAYINDASFHKLCMATYPNISAKDLPTACRSHTYTDKHLINLERDPIDSRFDHLILHEYGHILGMGDTYYEVNRNKDGSDAVYIPSSAVAGQPKSVMNGPNPISADDRDGIRSVWRSIQSGGGTNDFCMKGYVAKPGPRGIIFCKPVGNVQPIVKKGESTKPDETNNVKVADGKCPVVSEPGFDLKLNQRFTYFAGKSGIFVRQLNSQNTIDESVETTRSKCELVEISCDKEVIEKIGSYVKVKFSDGKQGYVHGSQIGYRKAATCTP